MSFTIGSLFDGSGGFPLAAFMCGGVPVWASEVEPYPIAVTKTRFPYMKHLGSVTDVKGDQVEPVDVITFGSPCQDLSVAGKRAGLKHEVNGDEETTRSGLFMEAVRIIKEMREATNGVYPRFALWENVPGAFSSNKGEDFRIVLEELIKIVEPSAVMPAVPKNGWPYSDHYCGDGWSLAYRVLDAQYWGVPQRRKRIYLVLDLGGQCAGKVLFEREGLRGYFEEGRTPWQTVTGDASDCVGTADCERNCVTLEPGIAAREGGHVYEGVSGTLRANAGDNQMAVAYPVEQLILDDQGGSQISVRDDGKCPTLRAEAHGNVPCVMDAIGVDVYNQTLTGNKAKTLNCAASDADHVPCVLESAGFKELNSANKHDASVCVKCYDARGNGDGYTAPTITGDHNNRVMDYTAVVVEPEVDIPVCYTMQGFGDYKDMGVASFLKQRDYKDSTDLVVEETPVVLDRAFYNQGVNAQYDPQLYTDGTCPTLVAKGPAAVCVRYIVRRLTPTECARLQGFPDGWGHPDHKDDFTDEEYEFWLNVRNTHAEINGKVVKSYTKAQMLTWYNKLHTDSSEYKLWGNGIALPCALYVMQGIADVFK